MPSPATIDIDSLLKPIAGENPAGKDVDFVSDQQIKDWRVEKDPANYSANDPNRPKSFQPPKWLDIVRLCKEQLSHSSKYPILPAYLTEALTRQHGFAGARDGFILLRQLADKYMDQLYPNKPIEEPDDIDIRLKGVRWLDDKDRGAQLEKTLNEAPILKYANPEERLDISVSLADLKSPENQSPKVTEKQLADWLHQIPEQVCVTFKDDVIDCHKELDNLLQVLNSKAQALLTQLNLSPEKAKELADMKVPGLTRCKAVLTKAKEQLEELLSQKASLGQSGGGAPGAAATGGGGGATAGVGQSRDQLYDQLKQIAVQLEKLDAHSPVPLLILKAVELREMKFPKLVELLNSDARVLQFITPTKSDMPPA